MRIFSKDREQVIIQLFHRGDASAMDELYAEYADYLSGVCYRYITDDDDLKDVLQESFIRIFTQISQFEYHGKGSLRAWVTRVTVNECLQLLRKQKKATVFNLDVEPPDIPEEDPDTEGLTGDTLTHLIRQLPSGYRTVLNLFVIEEKSHKEIAEIMGIKPDTSASQYHRAKNMLARLIKEYIQQQQ